MKNSIYLLLIVCVLSLIGCGKTKPQSPSNRRHTSHADSVSMAMIMLNQRLATEADKDVLQYVREQDSDTFSLSDNGCWFRKTAITDNSLIDTSVDVDLRMVLYSLDGQMYIDNREVVKIQGGELLQPVIEALTIMRYGEKAELIAPWYAAYGMAGNSHIPPYTNLRILIETF